MRVAERLKKAIAVDPTRAVVDYNKILKEEHNEEEPQEFRCIRASVPTISK